MTDNVVTILKKPPLLRSVEGEQLLALARTVKVGDTLTYARVLADLAVDLRSAAGRQLWHKVQVVLADDDRMQFACVATIGYRRLAEGEKVGKSGRYIGQAVKRVRAAGRVLATVDRSALTSTEGVVYDVQTTVVGLLHTVAKPAIAVSRATPPSKAEIADLVTAMQRLG